MKKNHFEFIENDSHLQWMHRRATFLHWIRNYATIDCSPLMLSSILIMWSSNWNSGMLTIILSELLLGGRIYWRFSPLKLFQVKAILADTTLLFSSQFRARILLFDYYLAVFEFVLHRCKYVNNMNYNHNIKRNLIAIELHLHNPWRKETQFSQQMHKLSTTFSNYFLNSYDTRAAFVRNQTFHSKMLDDCKQLNKLTQVAEQINSKSNK